MSRSKNIKSVRTLVAIMIIGAVASSIIIAYDWQSIFPSKYPMALSGIIFSTNNQIESVTIGIQSKTNASIITNLITVNTTGLDPLATPQNIQQGGKYATSDYITSTKYVIGQTIVIDRISNVNQTHERLTIIVTSKMLQYTAGYYDDDLQSTHVGYAIAVPTNAEWSPTPE